MDRVRKVIECEGKDIEAYTGKGIYVAVLDSGVGRHPDLAGRIVAFRDFTGNRKKIGSPYFDDNGHGTHVCGILAGNGMASAGKYRGIAPECLLICGKVLDYKGGGSLKNLLKGLQWIVEMRKKYPIRILNISIEMEESAKLDKDELLLLHQYLEHLWQEGVMIIAAAGNRGPEPMSISPISENGSCVCVSCHDGDFVGADGRSCAQYSGRGPGKGTIPLSKQDNPLKKPDMVAPGTEIVSCCHKLHPLYIPKSGTSMATPIISGACALLMQKYPEITNIQVKRCLLKSARDLGETWDVQGAGMISVRRLLQSMI